MVYNSRQMRIATPPAWKSHDFHTEITTAMGGGMLAVALLEISPLANIAAPEISGISALHWVVGVAGMIVGFYAGYRTEEDRRARGE